MTNKVLRKKNKIVLFVDLINQDLEKKSTTTKNNLNFLQTNVIK